MKLNASPEHYERKKRTLPHREKKFITYRPSFMLPGNVDAFKSILPQTMALHVLRLHWRVHCSQLSLTLPVISVLLREASKITQLEYNIMNSKLLCTNNSEQHPQHYIQISHTATCRISSTARVMQNLNNHTERTLTHSLVWYICPAVWNCGHNPLCCPTLCALCSLVFLAHVRVYYYNCITHI